VERVLSPVLEVGIGGSGGVTRGRRRAPSGIIVNRAGAKKEGERACAGGHIPSFLNRHTRVLSSVRARAGRGPGRCRGGAR